MRLFLLISSAFFCLLTLPVIAQVNTADILDVSKLEPLYQPKQMSLEAFEKLSAVLTREPSEGDPFSYQIRVPKDWLVTLDNNLKYEVVGGQTIGTIAEYISPEHPKGRARIIVRSDPTFRDVYMKDMFLAQALADGTSIRSVEDKDNLEVEAEYVKQLEGRAVVYRGRSFIHGPRNIYVEFVSPIRRYLEFKDLQAHVINSFEILSEPTEELEDRRVFAFLNKAKLSYPEGLVLTSQRVFSINHVSARFLNLDLSDFPNGTIRFDMYRKDPGFDWEKQLAQTKEEFSNEDQRVSEVIEEKDYETDESVKLHEAKIYGIRTRLSRFEIDKLGKVKNELLIAYLEDDEFNYIASVLTPTRQDNLIEWSRNMRAFEIMAQSLQKIPEPDIFPPKETPNEGTEPEIDPERDAQAEFPDLLHKLDEESSEDSN